MVAHGRNLGGIERHVIDLSRALTAAGHQVAFAGPGTGWLGKAIRDAGHECIHLPMRGMYDPWSVWKLRRFARTWKAHILHGHAQRGMRYALQAAGGRLPVIATAHSTNSWTRFRRDHLIIAVSDAVRDFLLSKGFSPELTRTVHLGVDDLGLAKAARSGPISPERPLMLGMLSRIEPVKGHDLALEAVRLLEGRLPVRLIVTGPDTTEWAEQMKARTRELGLQDRVEFAGGTSNIQPVFDRMDIMLAPSRREALCLSLIEAAAAGRPSIGSNIGGIPEVIKEGISGLLVPTEDPAALAEAILQLGCNETLRLNMGQTARSVYERSFTRQAMVRGTEDAYMKALGRAGGQA
ncbi:MAG: glycosyltransferase [Paracoccus sp. (in: a-proteobacteria)]